MNHVEIERKNSEEQLHTEELKNCRTTLLYMIDFLIVYFYMPNYGNHIALNCIALQARENIALQARENIALVD